MVITGQSLNFMSLSSSTGLKWTVSETEPNNPKTGDLWVVASPDEVTISQVVLMQSDAVSVENAEPNTIYLLIPYDGTTMPADAFEINYIENDKCTLTAICTTMIVTGDDGTALEIDRAIYTGTEWHTWTGFPSEPSSYNLIDTYTSSQTWTAPESGWFQIEVFGASGNGGACAYSVSSTTAINSNSYAIASGGGGSNGVQGRYTASEYYNMCAACSGSGGGGGSSCSVIKMNQGDTISLTVGGVGSTCSAVISSSITSYSSLTVTSGTNGSGGTASLSTYKGGSGGSGGVASGGQINVDGSAGATGAAKSYLTKAGNEQYGSGGTLSAKAGGAAGHTDGNAGGSGCWIEVGNYANGSTTGSNYFETGGSGSGRSGFIKIYRGNTNLTA